MLTGRLEALSVWSVPIISSIFVALLEQECILNLFLPMEKQCPFQPPPVASDMLLLCFFSGGRELAPSYLYLCNFQDSLLLCAISGVAEDYSNTVLQLVQNVICLPVWAGGWQMETELTVLCQLYCCCWSSCPNFICWFLNLCIYKCICRYWLQLEKEGLTA